MKRLSKLQNAPRQTGRLLPNYLNKGVADANCDPGAFLGLTWWFHSRFVALLCFAVQLLLFVPARGYLKSWGGFHAWVPASSKGGGGASPNPVLQWCKHDVDIMVGGSHKLCSSGHQTGLRGSNIHPDTLVGGSSKKKV